MREERVKVSESRTLTREGRSEREQEEVRVESTVNEGRRRGRASKKSLPRRNRRKHGQVGGRKSSPGQSAKSWFHSKSDQI